MIKLKEIIMNKSEALALLDAGLRITHKHFTSDEYMIKYGHGYEFEDGCRCTSDQFWNTRLDKAWETGWSIHKSTPSVEVDEFRSKELYLIGGRYYYKRGVHCDQFGLVHKIVEGVGFSDVKLTRDQPYSFRIQLTHGNTGELAAVVTKDVNDKAIKVQRSGKLSMYQIKKLNELCLKLRTEFILSDAVNFVITSDLKVYEVW